MLKSSSTSPKAARTETAGGSNTNNKKKNHPFYIASLFDVFAQLESEVQGTWGFRNSHMTIVTRDSDSQEAMEWVIRGSAYGALDIVLEVDGVYFLKGRLLALNQPGEQKFYYEPKNQILATTSKELQGDLANAVSAHGLGIIISRDVEIVSPGKENVVVVVRHTDYNPEIRGLSTFDVQYRCSWSPLMEKLQPLLTPNREVLLAGHIIGKDMSKHMWIVEITGVSVTSGPSTTMPVSPSVAGETVVTPGGRSRGKMIFEGNTPLEGSSKDMETEAAETKTSNSTVQKRPRSSAAKGNSKPKTKKPRATKAQLAKALAEKEAEEKERDPPTVEHIVGSVKGKEKAISDVEEEEEEDEVLEA